MLLKNLLSSTVRSLYFTRRELIKLKANKQFVFQHECLYSTKDPFETTDSASSSIQCEDDKVSDQSEINYFSSCHRENFSKPLSVKQCLNYTNKVMFGPLLETSAEKRRKLKQEKKSTLKQGKKENVVTVEAEKKSNLDSEALIHRSENLHLLNDSCANMGHSTTNYQLHIPKVKIKIQQNSDHDRVTDDTKKIHFLKKIAKHYPNTFSPSASIKCKKIIVTSRTVNREGENPVLVASHDSGAVHVYCHETEHDSELDYNSPLVKCKTAGNVVENSETCDQNKPFVRYECSNPIKNEVLNISIDNSEFSAVPNVLNLHMVENFPLFNNHACVVDNWCAEKEQTISSIGIFDNGYQKLPSVRKILDATMPTANKIALEKWKAKMIKKLGEDGFEKYRKDMLDRGSLFHGCIQSELSGASPSVEDMPTIGCLWTSVKRVLPDVSEVRVLESRIIHPYLHYQGAVDCVAQYKGTPVLIEWKTSSKPKLSVKSMFDDPVQLVAYLGALSFDEL